MYLDIKTNHKEVKMRRQKDLIIAIAFGAMLLVLSLSCASRQAKVMEPQPAVQPVVNADTLDSDGDGVLDRWDMCPSTRLLVEGVHVDASGCVIRDDNNNGIPDDKEWLWRSYGTDFPFKTREEPAAAQPEKCQDEDADGVCDSVDNCPQTPTEFAVDSNGCPSGIVVNDINMILLDDNISSINDLIPKAKAVLDSIAMILKAHPTVEMNFVACLDTGSVGDLSLCQKSHTLTSVVHDYLVTKGVNPSRLKYTGDELIVPMRQRCPEKTIKYSPIWVELHRLDSR